MIVAEPKSFAEVMNLSRSAQQPVVVGCATCVAVCLAGGEREADLLALKLRLAHRENPEFSVRSFTIERQCDREFLAAARKEIGNADCLISLACGAGVQFLAETYPDIKVVPGLNTSFIGVTEAPGVWTERCSSCNQCYLGLTGGICPVTMCAKGLLNGPCGGPKNGKCEVDADRDCAWVQIITRLHRQSRLDILTNIVEPMNHARSARPNKITRPEYNTR